MSAMRMGGVLHVEPALPLGAARDVVLAYPREPDNANSFFLPPASAAAYGRAGRGRELLVLVFLVAPVGRDAERRHLVHQYGVHVEVVVVPVGERAHLLAAQLAGQRLAVRADG